MRSASIVIPVFNRADLVPKAIDSALEQTHPCEVILVDHGSTDHIGEVAASYGDRIRYIRRSQDRGPVASWKDGLKQATGDYVHITFDDDWIQPEFMERCLERFDQDVAFVYTRVRLHHSSEARIDPSVLHPGGKQPIERLVKHLLRTPFSLSPGCAVFRRRDAVDHLLDEVPGASGAYGPQSGVGEDLLLFLLTTLHYSSYVHVAEPLADFLAHPGSITIGAIRGGQAKELAESYEMAKEFYLSHPGAIERPSKLVEQVHTLWWIVASGASGTYAYKALKRATSRANP